MACYDGLEGKIRVRISETQQYGFTQKHMKQADHKFRQFQATKKVQIRGWKAQVPEIPQLVRSMLLQTSNPTLIGITTNIFNLAL